jgi:hypothetical protein
MFENPNDLVKLSGEIKDRLPEETGKSLQILLDQHEEIDDADNQIIDLLSQYDNVLPWMSSKSTTVHDLLKNTKEKVTSMGSTFNIPSCMQWECPKVGCDISYPVIDKSEDPPSCSVHHVTMKMKL